MINNQIKFAFFGSSHFSVIVLECLAKHELIPHCIITTPDKPQGRGMKITPNEVKTWARARNIKVYDPAILDNEFARTLNDERCQVFLVASYGKIIPASVIDLPQYKTLNIHPSLLPRYRGASPLQSAILNDDKETGVSIMRIDEKMDHGPIIAKKEVTISEWPIYEQFEEMMANIGGELLADILPEWIAGKIEEQEQDHSLVTFTKKITKEDALIDLNGDPYQNFLKIQAFHEWPQAYFFLDRDDKKIRVKITSASFDNGALIIEKVIPEDKKEMVYEEFRRVFAIK